MNLRRILGVFALLVIGLALAGCGGNGPATPRGSNTGAAPATPPGSNTAAPPATPAAYPLGTAAYPAYPLETPAPEALPPAAAYPYPYPMVSDTPAAAGGKSADAALIDLAKHDLAQRLSVTTDQITVVSSAYMDWPDSSLGCPKPGMAYAQMISPGYRIVLEQAQKQYDYHTNLTDQLVLCAP